MARPIASRSAAVLIYLNAFVVGGVLMGFEMLGSRYLFPYFGGGIGTWASLISTVLCGLAIGYFAGGAIVDRYPSRKILAVAILLAAIYLSFIPLAADGMMSRILATLGDGAWAVVLAANALLLVPFSFLGTFSPIAVRLLTQSATESGRIAGLVYGVSTIGNVVGTLLTTFTLIPTIGSRSITYVYALILALCAGSLLLPIARPLAKRGTLTALLVMLGGVLLATLGEVPVADAQSAVYGTSDPCARAGSESKACATSPIPVRSTVALVASQPSPEAAGWSGRRALDDIATQLSFGVRAIGSPGHEMTVHFIGEQMAKLAGAVEYQRWTEFTRGRLLTLTNIIARFAPTNPHRILVGTHYDSIIRAYRDAEQPDALMPGANNSASGVALLLETARVMSGRGDQPTMGVDLVFFDGEEGAISMGEGDSEWSPVGSLHFARHIRDLYPKENPQEGIIFDMVCYNKLKLYPEKESLQIANEQVSRFWQIGAELAPNVFSLTPTRTPIFDDHLSLATIGIPSFLVIGFDYAPWFNTTKDTLDKCSTESLEAVGRTLLSYLYAASEAAH